LAALKYFARADNNRIFAGRKSMFSSEKWVHFSDENMLQRIEAARILVTRVIPPEWNAR
jgi:hypothetical protein